VIIGDAVVVADFIVLTSLDAERAVGWITTATRDGSHPGSFSPIGDGDVPLFAPNIPALAYPNVPFLHPRVVRVMHPWLGENGVPVTWRQRSAAVGVPFSISTLARWAASSPDLPGTENQLGTPNRRTSTELVAVLGRHTPAGEAVFFAYADPATGMAGYERSVIQGTLGDLEAIRRQFVYQNGTPIPGPEFWWPASRTWIVGTDYDSWWTDISGPSKLITDLLHNADLEVIEAEN
jgi:hypothetical protein